MGRLFLPEKPVIPIGKKYAGPNCGFAGLYQRTDLLYRAV
jgi:hypothetical protein